MEAEMISDKLELRAIKEEWPITNEKRTEIIERAMVRAQCGDPDIEDKAAKILIAADVVNLKRQQLEQKKLDADHARKLQLIEAAIRLGIIDAQRSGIGVASIEPSAS